MPRCKNCKELFEVKRFNSKYCDKVDCKTVEAMQNLEKLKQKEQKDWTKRKKEKKITTHSKEYKAELQNQINLLARKIDGHFKYDCIDCGKPYGKQVDGAHKNNVGGHENIRYNLHNIHSARAFCNQRSSEHKVGYSLGLEERYGFEYREYVEFEIDKVYKYIGLNSIEIYESLKIVRKLNRDFEKHTDNFKDGREAREYFNNIIGIYIKND